ncbi:MAG: cysteine desulfurase family protein [Terriglobales bacterium]
MACVYFDNNATSPMLPEVLGALEGALQGGMGNPSSIHQRGQAAKAALDEARAQTAGLLNAEPDEIVFTSGGTESNNLAIRGVVEEWQQARRASTPPHVITTRIEHHAVLNVGEELEKEGIPVTYLPISATGRLDPASVGVELRPNTALISVMMANNETGVLQPVEEVGALARAAGVRFHVDAVQALGKVPVDVTSIGCDLLSLSGHKLHAAPGVGALFVRRGTRLHPQILGGHQERDHRGGTENVPGIVSLGAACRLARADTAGVVRLARLRDRLEAGILAAIPDCGVAGGDQPRVPNTTDMYFDGIEGEALVIGLDLQGFCVSTGAACTSGSVEPSHVLLAMGYSRRRARGCLRFSLGRQNTEAEVDSLLQILPQLVERQRRLMIRPALPPLVQSA